MNKFKRFMYNKYGMDELNMALLYLSLGLSFVMILFRNFWLQLIFTYIPMIILFVRALSKNYSARRLENDRYLVIIAPYKKKWNKFYNKIKNRKMYKYYTCKNCKQELRVPKGRGNVVVTCPRCKSKFERKT